MTYRRTTLRLVGMALLALALALVVVLVTSGCGDKFEGTWKLKGATGDQTIKISKDGGKYVVTDPNDSSQKITAEEKDGKLILKDPSGKDTQEITIESQGDKLVMKAAGVSIELEKAK